MKKKMAKKITKKKIYLIMMYFALHVIVSWTYYDKLLRHHKKYAFSMTPATMMSGYLL